MHNIYCTDWGERAEFASERLPGSARLVSWGRANCYYYYYYYYCYYYYDYYYYYYYSYFYYY